jgi:hypothetical protein
MVELNDAYVQIDYGVRSATLLEMAGSRYSRQMTKNQGDRR